MNLNMHAYRIITIINSLSIKSLIIFFKNLIIILLNYKIIMGLVPILGNPNL